MIYVALVGLTLIVVRGTIFNPLQNVWPALFRCAQCTGMWIGMVAGSSGLTSTGAHRIVDTIIAGGATSFLSLLADAILLKLLGDPGD